jgi:prepilin-type N-terminal cleavage/methylation domain-containing protein
MHYKLRTYKAFTLIELLVAIGLLAIVMSFAGVIFRVCINAHRTAMANVEIMQKLRAITNQLDSDFKGLRKDGEIAVTWSARPAPATGYKDNDLDGYERFDRIMFFADGDFQSYRVNPMVRGNVAMICYMLANKLPNNPVSAPIRPVQQEPQKRILARTQHILTDNPALNVFLDPNNASDQQLYLWNNYLEYDKTTLDEWKIIPWAQKANLLSVIFDVVVGQSNASEQIKGSQIDPADPNSIHMLLCEGVGEFKIQSWYDAQRRWVPEVDPDGDGFLLDTDFIPTQDGTGLDPVEVPGVIYPYRSWYPIDPNSYVRINNIIYPGPTDPHPELRLNQSHFNEIPGLGRALKFTFTLFDSKGIIKEGRTFTHIVYLDD